MDKNRRHLYELVGNEYGLSIREIEMLPMIHFLQKFEDFAMRIRSKNIAAEKQKAANIRNKAVSGKRK